MVTQHRSSDNVSVRMILFPNLTQLDLAEPSRCSPGRRAVSARPPITARSETGDMLC